MQRVRSIGVRQRTGKGAAQRAAGALTAIVALAACGNDANEALLNEPVVQVEAEARDAELGDAGFQPIDVAAVALTTLVQAESAVDIAFHPTTGDIHVVEHDGRVVRFGDDGATVVLDISERVVDHRDEQGLIGLEFSPDGQYVWIHYTSAVGVTIISEMTVTANGMFDVGSERLLIEIDDPPGLHHNGGDLLLADDGTLYITLGDGDAADRSTGEIIPTPDPHRIAHDPTTLRGSILRVRPTPGADTTHTIPDDNPFANGPLTADDGRSVEGLPEVFAWGFRNPWKISIDAASESLWIADVGGSDLEEINIAFPVDGRPAGWAQDYGWSGFEASNVVNADVVPAFNEPTPPSFEYEHTGLRCAISGGAVYRGANLPSLWSGYVYADFCDGSVWVYDSTTGTERRIAGDFPGITGVHTGPDNELYVSSWFGEVRRIDPL